jgi:hypothetical protein
MSILRSAAATARSQGALFIQLAMVGLLLVECFLEPRILQVLRLWALWALHAAGFAAAMWNVDGAATLLLSLAFLAKILLALAPTVMFIAVAPRWRILGLLAAGGILLIAPAYLRACPTSWHWGALCLASALGVVLVRRRFHAWAMALPMVVLLALPWIEHGFNWDNDPVRLAERCAANDGERPSNVETGQFDPFYYGVHFFPPDWILLMGETPLDGRFMNLSHGGKGSWWLKKGPDGTVSFWGASQVTGNTWTSCMLGGDAWMVRARMLYQVRPPGADGRETVNRFPVLITGFDAPDTACDERMNAVFSSDLVDGRLFELSPRTGGRVERRADAVSDRGGIMIVRELDGRLVMLDFQDLIVYALDEARVVQRTPAVIASSSFAMCRQDGAVAVPDLAGRLRLFKVDGAGGYQFDWGVDLFAPRFARFSSDCAFIGVTSADDRRVWIIDRAAHEIVKTFELGPAIRGAAFIGPRQLAVADACTVSVLRF